MDGNQQTTKREKKAKALQYARNWKELFSMVEVRILYEHLLNLFQRELNFLFTQASLKIPFIRDLELQGISVRALQTAICRW